MPLSLCDVIIYWFVKSITCSVRFLRALQQIHQRLIVLLRIPHYPVLRRFKDCANFHPCMLMYTSLIYTSLYALTLPFILGFSSPLRMHAP